MSYIERRITGCFPSPALLPTYGLVRKRPYRDPLCHPPPLHFAPAWTLYIPTSRRSLRLSTFNLHLDSYLNSFVAHFSFLSYAPNMSLHLPVSSFPDVVFHDSASLDLDVRILVTPPPSRKRLPYLTTMFGKDTSRSPTPNAISGADPERTDAAAVSEWGASPTQCILYPRPYLMTHPPNTPRSDIADHHQDAHHRSTSRAQLRHSPSLWLEAYPTHRAPLSTKESIAILGLSRRTPSPDSSLSDTDSMVACCGPTGWVEPQALPPLPPVPPPSPPSLESMEALQIIPPQRSSSLPRDEMECCESLDEDNDDAETADGQDLEIRSDASSIPPSPITFSHRNSTYIAVESSSGAVKSLNNLTVTTVSLNIDSTLRRRAAAASPTPTTPSTKVASPSAELARDVATQHPWTRTTPFSAAALLIPSPKLLKPGQTYEPHPQPTTSSHSKLSVKLHSWKIFKRSHSPGPQPAPESCPTQTADSDPRCLLTGRRRGRRHHRSSVHFGSISSLPSEEAPSLRRSSVGSDQTMGTASDTTLGLSERRSVGTLRSVTTHRAEGDTWREEDIGAVLDTLRTMRAGKMK